MSAEVARRLALATFGGLLGLAALEVAMRVGAWFAPSSRPLTALARVVTTRLLCVGDSNVYGLWVERDEAYPQVLERLWNVAADPPRLEVLNLGVPGMTTSKLRNALPEMLDIFRPDHVAITVGANDFWMEPEPVGAGRAASTSMSSRFWRASRVYRLLVMLARSATTPHLDVSLDYGPTEGKYSARFDGRELAFDWKPRGSGGGSETESNLTAMIDAVRDAGAQPILVTYASANWFYSPASAVIRRVAAATQTRLVDLAPAFAMRCVGPPCPLLFPDGHPSASGYALAAEIVLRELEADDFAQKVPSIRSLRELLGQTAMRNATISPVHPE
jgi:lysophospholipase L1-like esterase